MRGWRAMLLAGFDSSGIRGVLLPTRFPEGKSRREHRCGDDAQFVFSPPVMEFSHAMQLRGNSLVLP